MNKDKQMFDFFGNTMGVILDSIKGVDKEFIKAQEQKVAKEFRFETLDEAETYYWENYAKNNADEAGRDNWTSDISDDIRECYEEDHPKLQDDEVGKDKVYDR